MYNTFFNDTIECKNCKTNHKYGALIKLKDRYCCPKCYSTILTLKEFKRDMNNYLSNKSLGGEDDGKNKQIQNR